MHRWRFLRLFGLLKPRKHVPITTSDLLTDGDGVLLVDENGDNLTG